MTGEWATWRAAMTRALYGPEGFYRKAAGQPARHFRTSAHASPLFARAVLSLARSAGLATVVDVGAGGGELLSALHALDPSLRLVGVEVAPRPAGLAPSVEWRAEPGEVRDALVVANEWLDNVPVEVVEQTVAGPRLVEVCTSGAERVGGAPEAADLAWLAHWWPLAAVGDRAEVGRSRDEAWAALVKAVRRGVLVAVDYAHSLESRPPSGSLAGYRSGRRVEPGPDGSCDVTAHVALDSCAAAGEAVGATASLLLTQREALRAVGIRATRPDVRLAATDSSGYLAALQLAGEAAELTARGGLGDFGWLVQAVGTSLPDPLAEPPLAEPKWTG